MLDALLQAVNHDGNVNVRLSAVDALKVRRRSGVDARWWTRFRREIRRWYRSP